MKILLLCVLLWQVYRPQPLLADDFYKGKTVRVIVGGTAGEAGSESIPGQ